MQTHDQAAKSTSSGTVLLLAIWTLAWVATLALAKFGPALLWNEQPVASWIAIAVNIAVGVAWIVAHAQYLRGVDDLQRKILMDALAIALGAGLVGGFAYSAANTAGLICARLRHRVHLRAHGDRLHRRHGDRLRSLSMRNRLKALRAERNWTQAELADRLSVSRQSVNAIEKEKFDPSLPIAFRIARLFGLTIEEIFHADE